jgi:hypothetical protein
MRDEQVHYREQDIANRAAAAGIDAGNAHAPHSRAIRWLSIGLAVLTVGTTLALLGYVANRSANNATVACQGQLQRNQDAQNVAGTESRRLLRVAAQVLADGAASQAADIDVMLDPNATDDAVTAAALDFKAQAGAISLAWQTYVDESAKADDIRAANPTTFRC